MLYRDPPSQEKKHSNTATQQHMIGLMLKQFVCKDPACGVTEYDTTHVSEDVGRPAGQSIGVVHDVTDDT